MKHIFTAVIFFGVGLCSCKKEKNNIYCDKLKAAIKKEDIIAAMNALTAYMNQLPAQSHTADNLKKLTQLVSSRCDADAVVLCFACIDTLPEQSEIKISFGYNSNRFYKIFDISHTPDNKMKVRNMHD